MTARRTLMACAAIIAGVDLAQVFVLGKGIGAIGGFVIYGAVAVGAWRGARWASAVAMVVPVIPLLVFSGLLGVELRAALVDRPMVAVFCVQIAAFTAGALTLLSGREREGASVR